MINPVRVLLSEYGVDSLFVICFILLFVVLGFFLVFQVGKKAGIDHVAGLLETSEKGLASEQGLDKCKSAEKQ